MRTCVKFLGLLSSQRKLNFVCFSVILTGQTPLPVTVAAVLVTSCGGAPFIRLAAKNFTGATHVFLDTACYDSFSPRMDAGFFRVRSLKSFSIVWCFAAMLHRNC